MKTRDSIACLRTISASLVLSAMFVLSCTTLAQDEITINYPAVYRAVEDPGQRLMSLRNVELAFAFAFDSKKFSDLWPGYGYDYNEIRNSIEGLCRRGDTNFDIGKSAIARNVPNTSMEQNVETYVALSIEENTNPKVFKDFLGAQDLLDSQADWHVGSNHSMDDSRTVTIGEMCTILSGNSGALAGTVIVTQHPLPVSERHSLRLLKEGIIDPGTDLR